MISHSREGGHLDRFGLTQMGCVAYLGAKRLAGINRAILKDECAFPVCTLRHTRGTAQATANVEGAAVIALGEVVGHAASLRHGRHAVELQRRRCAEAACNARTSICRRNDGPARRSNGRKPPAVSRRRHHRYQRSA